jgi:hypothetical protein
MPRKGPCPCYTMGFPRPACLSTSCLVLPPRSKLACPNSSPASRNWPSALLLFPRPCALAAFSGAGCLQWRPVAAFGGALVLASLPGPASQPESLRASFPLQHPVSRMRPPRVPAASMTARGGCLQDGVLLVAPGPVPPQSFLPQAHCASGGARHGAGRSELPSGHVPPQASLMSCLEAACAPAPQVLCVSFCASVHGLAASISQARQRFRLFGRLPTLRPCVCGCLQWRRLPSVAPRGCLQWRPTS